MSTERWQRDIMELQFVTKGWFEALESFAIKRRNEFYILGRKESKVQVGWLANVRFSNNFTIPLKIKEVENSEGGNEGSLYGMGHPDKGYTTYNTSRYQLLIIAGDTEEIESYLDLQIGRGGSWHL